MKKDIQEKLDKLDQFLVVFGEYLDRYKFRQILMVIIAWGMISFLLGAFSGFTNELSKMYIDYRKDHTSEDAMILLFGFWIIGSYTMETIRFFYSFSEKDNQ